MVVYVRQRRFVEDVSKIWGMIKFDENNSHRKLVNSFLGIATYSFLAMIAHSAVQSSTRTLITLLAMTTLLAV